ncbi:MAG: 50S ribosomal protein L11 methyltransferase [Desulfobacca sp.]|uniref:50S ribosomal protein L11 methyltransferase n=1 Tax=Desulfobacca sp. TaxID=2067990 RepID=UPI0040497EA9
MYFPLTPTISLASTWQLCWPRPGHRLVRLRQSGTFPVSHPSTWLSLTLLTAVCQDRHLPSLLDVGCGSGVLAIAGALLGIPWVVGCDLMAAATQVSRENARRAGVEPRIHWLQGSTEALAAQFRLIVANLPLAVQMAKQAEFVRLLAPGGCLILAGFKDTGEGAVAAFYLSRGWRELRRLTKECWEMELPPERSYTWVGLALQAPAAG